MAIPTKSRTKRIGETGQKQKPGTRMRVRIPKVPRGSKKFSTKTLPVAPGGKAVVVESNILLEIVHDSIMKLIIGPSTALGFFAGDFPGDVRVMLLQPNNQDGHRWHQINVIPFKMRGTLGALLRLQSGMKANVVDKILHGQASFKISCESANGLVEFQAVFIPKGHKRFEFYLSKT